MLSKKENRDEQVILRDLYRDKEFLRYGMLSKKGNNLFQVSTGRSSCVSKKTRRSNAFLRRASSSLQRGWKWSNFSRYIQTFSHLLLNFSTYRSDFWRKQKPMYVEEGERVTRRMSMMEDTQTRMKRGPDKTALFTIRLNIWSSLFALWSLILI